MAHVSINESLINAFNGSLTGLIFDSQIISKLKIQYRVSYNLFSQGDSRIRVFLYSKEKEYEEFLNLKKKWGFVIEVDYGENWIGVNMILGDVVNPDQLKCRRYEYVFDRFKPFEDIRDYLDNKVALDYKNHIEALYDNHLK